MTFVNVFDDGSKASKLLQDDLKNRNLHLNIVKVDPTDTLQEWFTKINGDNKTYLHFTYEDYTKDHEKLRKEVDKVEHLGFRNLIVREYEGLDQKTMEYRYNIIAPKPVQKKFHVGKDDDVYEIDESTPEKIAEIKKQFKPTKTLFINGKLDTKAVDDLTNWEDSKYTGESVVVKKEPPKMGIPAEFPSIQIDPDDEMKAQVKDIKEGDTPEPPTPKDFGIDKPYISNDNERFKFKSEEFKNKRRRKVSDVSKK